MLLPGPPLSYAPCQLVSPSPWALNTTAPSEFPEAADLQPRWPQAPPARSPAKLKAKKLSVLPASQTVPSSRCSSLPSRCDPCFPSSPYPKAQSLSAPRSTCCSSEAHPRTSASVFPATNLPFSTGYCLPAPRLPFQQFILPGPQTAS